MYIDLWEEEIYLLVDTVEVATDTDVVHAN